MKNVHAYIFTKTIHTYLHNLPDEECEWYPFESCMQTTYLRFFTSSINSNYSGGASWELYSFLMTLSHVNFYLFHCYGDIFIDKKATQGKSTARKVH